MPAANAAKAPAPSDELPIATQIPTVKLPQAGDDGKKAYLATFDPKDAQKVYDLGIDRTETDSVIGADGKASAELVLSEAEAAKLTKAGISVQVRGNQQAKAGLRSAAPTGGVFKHYAGEGGLAAEMLDVAKANPDITKVVSIGKSTLGQDILAIKVSKEAKTSRDGTKPPVLYVANQHAREWITPEMNRRLLHYYVDGYKSNNQDVKKIVNSTELWFVLSANPDGYEWTWQPGQRQWRKTLRDNDGNGVITGADGVDPNRNFNYKWGYDNEGSSADSFNDTWRGPGPNSEPETKALDNLLGRIHPRFVVNYHSAAQLLLYGVGWQVATHSPDDYIAQALAGNHNNPAVPGYEPELGAALYATNGDTDGYVDHQYGAIPFTPEMSTCETASNWDPNDAWDPADCAGIFNFPDDETLIQKEFTNNLGFALSVAKSAPTPDEPVSSLGYTAPDLAIHKFDTSYAEDGDEQPVAVDAKQKLTNLKINYKVNGGPAKTDGVLPWDGGKRYGQDGINWYKQYRGSVDHSKPGDSVEVWYTANKPGKGKVESEHFTYKVAPNVEKGADVLVIANEDYKGVNPTYPAGTNAPKYANEYLDALKASGAKTALWDVDQQGVPDALGVLGHFKAVVWYLGDNRLTQDAADEPTQVGSRFVPDSTVADRAFSLTMNVRDYLNEGGKLLYSGETTAYYGPLRGANGGGIYYGLKGQPDKKCVITTSYRDDCDILSDDFTQYWLGAYDRSSVNGVNGITGVADPLTGVNTGLPGTASNPVNEAGGFLSTSTVLPPAQFPQFQSGPAAVYAGVPKGPFTPFEGSKYVAGPHQDDSYMRLTRTVDLTGTTAADAPKLTAQVSWDTEESYDNVIFEAHTVGQDDWTTLPDLNGRSSTAVPAECAADSFLIKDHPFLAHYLTQTTPCTPSGSTGQWNAFTGNSGGWQQVAFDLSAYAGKQVEVSISFVTDPGSGGTGVFVDDTHIVKNGAAVESEGFENGLGAWSTPGPPPGDHSPANFLHTNSVFGNSAVATPDTLLLGFGLEQLPTQADKNAVMAKVVQYLLK
ncbi:M14 family zinc carboxypeptidase [Yinghuangia seranimata]|uniref:M14 family zinc carboxypeptidase n=1 Tax=Yinghuangia seranimata TaxID=408067 RepID=UPI00248B275A|nr:M14 family metallopeptidase [Yinghuangia seranimata]MDI2126289.1 M14 family zinc carboxypeptidase [Yinghuangia seranimata]